MELFTIILSSLAIVAFLICFILIYLKTNRVENLLTGIRALKTLNAEMRALNERLSKPGSQDLEDHLSAIQEMVQKIEGHLTLLIKMNSKGKEENLRDLIERRLYNMGYERVAVVSNLEEVDEEPFRIQVEAERKGILSKGFVVLQNNSIIEAKLHPITTVFP